MDSEEDKNKALLENLTTINGRPFIKNALQFFSTTRRFRSFFTFTDTDSWKQDIEIAEKMFGTLFVSSSDPLIADKVQEVKDVLKQRLKYPGINDRPDLLTLAKVWILSNKVQLVSDPAAFTLNFTDAVASKQKELEFELLSCVKFELSDGKERKLIYSMTDEGFRPSLILVKWSHDLDDNYSTAYCAGHLTNMGYVMLNSENGYCLYFYTGTSIYDTVSMKELCYGNPIAKSFADQFGEVLKSFNLSSIDDKTSPDSA